MIEKFLELGVVKFGIFRLSSGLESPFYIDLRNVLGEPELLRWVIEQYREILLRLKFDIIVGVATGGIPYASILGYTLGKPISYVRPEAKEHGTGRLIEGAEVSGREVVVIDDVLTTGKSIIGAINAIRSAGGIVAGAVVFLDREQCGSRNIKTATGVEVYSVYKMRGLLDRLKDYIDEEQYRSVINYLAQWRC
ncbi:orotate phosphoribosyltransferase [Pyrobaculum islandicum DSM 4184]|uniref:Orotate phosphoribosyltransferase n=1 Tax=Pyrobaculum islandicum (strain DSM 4184 / JCM 9189 / GEO3) TaxID=384616 RepID=PYRE_PYRIL|nr:orotate phosphoribosyltransferase [Pyrobaculum islandicum]A1RRV2.1 RecName: Full=Orotate phosphoribosyltransferase; Short=OPRT; Short=OPRTase [Pyrobaculum islandicum DSM 4184]ABL87684.1 orotate phosphoribosyltransferase [Pyrobaculum islandicum DSM 4184]